MMTATSSVYAAKGLQPDSDVPSQDQQTNTVEESNSNPILADIRRNYLESGRTRSCISIRAIRGTRVIDDDRIFFERNSSTAYINKLNRSCAGLAREGRFTYTTPEARLCQGTIITVLDDFGRAWGSCSLGAFEELKSIDRADLDPPNLEDKSGR